MTKELNRNKKIGDRVRQIRKRFNITQAQLSEVIGSRSEKNQLVRMIEHGQRNLTEKNIRRIAEAYNIQPGYLRLETDFMTYQEKMQSMFCSFQSEQDIRGKYFEMLLAKHGFTIRYQLGNQTFSRFQDCIITDKNNDSIVLTEEDLFDFMNEFEEHLAFQIQRKINKDKWIREEEKHLAEEESTSSYNPEEE